MTWQLGMFDVLAGDADNPTVCTTAGWYREPFGIDRRWIESPNGELEACFVINHLLTGYNICAFIGSEDEAMALADEFETLGDWDFVDPAGARPLAAAMGNIFKTRADIFNPEDCLPVLWLRVKVKA